MSKYCSMIRAAHNISPAATAWPMASSASPRLEYQAAALRCNCSYPAGLLLLQKSAEQVGEQVVIAPPATHLIQRDQEQARPFRLLQQRLAALAAGDGVAQRAVEPFQHRGLEQERPQLLVLPLEHLLGQVVQHVPVAAGERGHEAGGIIMSAQ